MTEAEWDACADPTKMLDHLKGAASDRKSRLLACACCRRVWPLLTDERSRRAVEVAERFADCEATPEEMEEAESSGNRACLQASAAPLDQHAAAHVAHLICRRDFGLPEMFRQPKGGLPPLADRAALLREVFGNPFRPVAPEPAWLAWSDGAVRRLAQAIYDDRAFDRLPLLADALEDAGCTDAAILSHCRGPGEHVRGCWVVDLLLGRT